MDFTIRKATQRDIPGLMKVMEEAVRTIRHADWFVPNDADYMQAQLQEEGLVLVAQAEDGEIAGFFSMHFPSLPKTNLGRDASLFEPELPKVAHMDSMAVLPAYRGHKIQKQMVAAGENELAALGYRHLFCTVHPDNHYSLSNLLELGYTIIVTIRKYGGLPRHILYKSNGPAISALRYPGLDAHLLALPGAQKDFKAEWQWLRYRVGGKLFAALCTPGLQYGAYGGRTMLILKCEPLLAELYRQQFTDVVPGFYSDKRNWNSVYLDADLPKELVWSMCTHAYEQVFAKLTKKMQREITGIQ